MSRLRTNCESKPSERFSSASGGGCSLCSPDLIPIHWLCRENGIESIYRLRRKPTFYTWTTRSRFTNLIKDICERLPLFAPLISLGKASSSASSSCPRVRTSIEPRARLGHMSWRPGKRRAPSCALMSLTQLRRALEGHAWQ